MKKTVLLLLVFLPLTGFTQKIEKNEKDDFTGSRIVYTNWERLHWGMKAGKGKQILTKFGHEADKSFFMLNWISDKVLSVDAKAPLLFKMDNGDIHTLYNDAYKIAGRGGATINPLWGSADAVGLSLIYNGDLTFLGKGVVTKIRITTNGGYVDIDLQMKESEKLQKQYTIFNKALD